MKQILTLKTLLIAGAATLIFTGTGMTAGMTTFEGTIQGANCVVNKTTCPLNASDPHVALENDFVLVTDSGNYFFLPNLSRNIKTTYLNQSVRITGDKTAHTIIASNVDVKNSGKYESVWNWEKIVKDINAGK